MRPRYRGDSQRLKVSTASIPPPPPPPAEAGGYAPPSRPGGRPKGRRRGGGSQVSHGIQLQSLWMIPTAAVS